MSWIFTQSETLKKEKKKKRKKKKQQHNKTKQIPSSWTFLADQEVSVSVKDVQKHWLNQLNQTNQFLHFGFLNIKLN